MDLTVDEFLEGLFSKETHEKPSDSKNPEDGMSLPPWYDEKKFNRGRSFYWSFCFAFSATMTYGLVAVFSIPSIIKVLVGSRRSNSTYTAYKRYLSTFLHTISWFENDLRPGTRSWKSLSTVRSRHFRAGLSAKLKGQGIVSQRDLALTQFGFIGFSLLKQDDFSIRQLEEGDWDAYIHFWRTIGYAIGLEDRYNLCRNTVEETREVCQILCDKVFTPSLCNVPECFEHMSRVMLDGLTCINPLIDVEASLFSTRYLANVPGYIYTEKDRIDIQRRIREHSPTKSGGLDSFGVDATALISKPLIELSAAQPRLLYYHEYDSIESSPQYKRLHSTSKYRLTYNAILYAFYSCFIFRFIFNMAFRYSLFLMKYLPYLAFFKYGITSSYVNIFVEDPTDNTEVKPNSAYEKPQPGSWLRCIFNSF